MEKIKRSWEKDGYTIRPVEPEDAENYYEQNFNPLDPEAARLTGCKSAFTREEVLAFIDRAVRAPVPFIGRLAQAYRIIPILPNIFYCLNW